MTICELIERLTEQWEKSGNVPVVFEHADGFHDVDTVEITTYREWGPDGEMVVVLGEL